MSAVRQAHIVTVHQLTLAAELRWQADRLTQELIAE
jgi:hypothetical protein